MPTFARRLIWRENSDGLGSRVPCSVARFDREERDQKLRMDVVERPEVSREEREQEQGADQQHQPEPHECAWIRIKHQPAIPPGDAGKLHCRLANHPDYRGVADHEAGQPQAPHEVARVPARPPGDREREDCLSVLLIVQALLSAR